MSGLRWMHREANPGEERFVQWVWRIFLLGILGFAAWITYLSFQDLPTFEELENPTNKLASQVFASEGALLGRYYVENRVPVPYSQLSPNLVNALIATEDIRYHRHTGIDFRALGRVAVKTVLLGQSGYGGGSTITQQLAKQLYSDRDFSGMGKVRRTLALVAIKMKEWITAVKLERAYTKEEILAMYLNHFNFINGAYGIKAASEIYFATSPDSLDVLEAATLVGMLKNPSYYNPHRWPERTQRRRNVVLRQMVKHNHLEVAAGDSLLQQPVDMSRFRRFSHDAGLAPYARMAIRMEVQQILDRPEFRKPDGSRYDIYRDGLKIYSTIDTAIQRELEEAVQDHMPGLQQKFWRVWKGMDPWTYRSEETTDAEITLRQQTLAQQIAGMDRTIALRAATLEPYIEERDLKIGRLPLRDLDMDRMLKDEKRAGYLRDLRSRRLISAGMLEDYREIRKGPHWTGLLETWNTYQSQVDTMLHRPVSMTIFSWDAPDRQKDTLMSPFDSLKYHRMILQAGSMAMDPANGHIRAWVGGVDYRFFQYDHVTSARQVGSTFKPFVYATAVALQSISPCTQLMDNPQTIVPGEGNFHLLQEWTPSNFSEYTGESMTMFEGLRKSVNTFSVYLMKQLGDTEPVRGLVHSMGIDSSARLTNGTYRVPRQPSICLGAADLSLYEMTGAYGTFANGGVYNKPILVTRIEDAYGRVLYQEVPLSRRALNEEANHVMVEMLRYATRGAGGFAGVKSDFGGKTGTTNFYADGWFMGITPSLVIGSWVGGEDRWIRFLHPADGQGSVLARPIFSNALKRIESNPFAHFDADRRFQAPPNLSIALDCTEYRQTGEEEIPIDEGDFFDDIFADPEVETDSL